MHNKIIILEHNLGGRLANQLWNFVSVYAYSLEKKLICENYSFFSYSKYFNIPKPKGMLPFLFYLPIIPYKLRFRLHRRYARFLKENRRELVIDSGDKEVIYLPPSDNAKAKDIENKLYTVGWLFRNPVGIERYRKEITEYFKPKKYILETARKTVSSLRNKYKEVIGVHIRQGDYPLVGDGQYFFTQVEVSKILKEYLTESGKNKNDIVFLICSDGKIDKQHFADLNTEIASGDLLEDIFTLSLTNRIIGSNSTYGAFAAYYGNIPIVCFSRGKIDWQSFINTNKFEYYNTATLVQQ